MMRWSQKAEKMMREFRCWHLAVQTFCTQAPTQETIGTERRMFCKGSCDWAWCSRTLWTSTSWGSAKIIIESRNSPISTCSQKVSDCLTQLFHFREATQTGSPSTWFATEEVSQSWDIEILQQFESSVIDFQAMFLLWCLFVSWSPRLPYLSVCQSLGGHLGCRTQRRSHWRGILELATSSAGCQESWGLKNQGIPWFCNSARKKWFQWFFAGFLD